MQIRDWIYGLDLWLRAGEKMRDMSAPNLPTIVFEDCMTLPIVPSISGMSPMEELYMTHLWFFEALIPSFQEAADMITCRRNWRQSQCQSNQIISI